MLEQEKERVAVHKEEETKECPRCGTVVAFQVNRCFKCGNCLNCEG